LQIPAVSTTEQNKWVPNASLGPIFLFDRADSGIDSASGTDAGVLREFGEHGSPPQNRVAHAGATLSDSPIPKIALGDFSRASSIRAQQYVNDQRLART
jgi:hypothetical protein